MNERLQRASRRLVTSSLGIVGLAGLAFAQYEWSDIPGIEGRYSRLYVDYVVTGSTGTFHCLNDWMTNQEDGGVEGGLEATESSVIEFRIGGDDYEIRISPAGSGSILVNGAPGTLPGFECACSWTTSPNLPGTDHLIWEISFELSPSTAAITKFVGRVPPGTRAIVGPNPPAPPTSTIIGPSAYPHVVDGAFSDPPVPPTLPPDPARAAQPPIRDPHFSEYDDDSGWNLARSPTGGLQIDASSRQTDIYGLNLRTPVIDFYSSNTASFVTSFQPVIGASVVSCAIDFDEQAVVLWGIEDGSRDYGTFDLSTGQFTAVGGVSGPPPSAYITGLTCDVNGVWYMSVNTYSPTASELWVGDFITGSFALVGAIGPGGIIDLAVDSRGNLYGHNISDDSLYAINPSTGAGTLIGPTGLPAIYAQGMDFDWSDDTLYATVYTGASGGWFCVLDLTTGAAIPREDTTALHAELEMACRRAPHSPAAFCSWYCGSGVDLDTYTVSAPFVLGDPFRGVVELSAPNVGAVIAGCLGQATFPIWGQEGLVNVAAREVMGLPAGFAPRPVTITWPVPNDSAYAGFHVFTQAAGFGGGVIRLTCAYDCTVGY